VTCKDDDEDEACKEEEEEEDKKEDASDETAADAEGEEKKEEAEEEKKEEETATESEEEKKEGDAAEGEEKKENETASEEEPKKKKKRTKTVEKEKKKVHKRTLKVDTYHVGRIKPYTSDILQESTDKLQALAAADKERMLLEESKNKVESYVYHIKNTLLDDEENISKVTNEEQRAEVLKLAEDAEEWMYDEGYDADLPTYEDKYAELSVPMEKIKRRVKEAEDRPSAIKALTKKLTKIEKLMADWVESLPQVTEEERAGVLESVEGVRKWIAEKEEEQSKTDPWEEPVFTSEEVPLQTKEIESAVKKLSKKPKPKPPAEEEKNEAEAEADGAKEEEGGEEKKEEGAEEAEAEGEKKEEEEAASEEAKADDEL